MKHPEIKLPAAFAGRMTGTLGHDYSAFASSLSEPSPVSLRRHPSKYPPGNGKPAHTAVPWCSLGLYLEKRPKFQMDPLWHGGAYYVQEASSMYLEQAFLLLDLPRDAVILDACAAPGGKSTHLLSLMDGDSLLVSNELIPKRNIILRENLEKWGYANVVVSQNKTEAFRRLPANFDLVVVDAPCSGEGLFRKDHKAMQEWSEAHVTSCSTRQQQILDDLAPTVRPGGYLIYSTCTYSVEEDEDRVRALLTSGEWEQVMLPTDTFSGLVRGGDGLGVRFFPHLIGGEGLYMSCLRKKGGPSGAASNSTVVKGNCPSELSDWLQTDEMNYYEFGDSGRVFPARHSRSLEFFRKRLRITSAGTETGRFIRGSLKPSHGLALSNLVSPALPVISLTLEDCIKYLKKETIPYDDSYCTGWNLVQFQGVNLGWSKVLDHRINNYYPKSLSIRP